MKHRILAFVLGAIIFGSIGAFAGQYIVNCNTFPVTLDGKNVYIEGYNINDSTYFGLRDISSVVGGFDVDFQNDTIILTTNRSNYVESCDIIWDETVSYGTSMLNIGNYNITVKDVSSDPPHMRGRLYINDVLVENNVKYKVYSDGVYAYYSVDEMSYNAIYKINLSTLEKKELIKTDEDHSISLMRDEYLIASGDFTSDFRIYNLSTDTETIIEDAFLLYPYFTKDGKLQYSRQILNNQQEFYVCDIDGSNETKVDEIK